MKTAVIWSQPDCVFCKKAKKLLLDNDYVYTEKVIGLGQKYTKKDLLDVVPNARSVPQIFIAGVHIGGYEELVKVL